MQLSSSMCRAQEAHHRDRAAGAQLENVRVIAAGAAAAWGQEALSAERREARKLRLLTTAEAAAAGQGGHDECERPISENPDRGFEDD